jgi:hypothetical protein
MGSPLLVYVWLDICASPFLRLLPWCGHHAVQANDEIARTDVTVHAADPPDRPSLFIPPAAGRTSLTSSLLSHMPLAFRHLGDTPSEATQQPEKGP